MSYTDTGINNIREFLESVADVSEGYQYDDGEEMASDAQEFLEYLNRLEKNRSDTREAIIDWYGGCPHAIKFINKSVSSYKKNFPDDDFMKEI